MPIARSSLACAVLIAACSAPAEPQPTPAPAPAVAPPASPPETLRTHRRPPPTREPLAPWSLTASDGTGLRVVAIDAKAVVEGPLAFTELHLTFANPEPRTREGTFAITLPARATVSRFATEEDGHYREAEVVPKALARRAYDDAIRRGIDPAILEKAAGNEFTARVFPIPPSGAKELVISYSQELASTGYVLPLAGLPQVERVAITLDAIRPDGTRQHDGLAKTDWQPDHDFVANVETPAAVASGDLVAAAFELDPDGAAGSDAPTALTILVDTSASRAPGFARYLARIETLVRRLAAPYAGVTVEIVAFDQETHVAYSGLARDFGDAEVAALAERRAAGASDLARAAASLHAPKRVIVITDGVITAGREGAELAAAFRATGAERVDVILAGGVRDEHVAAALTRTGARPGDVFDLDEEVEPTLLGLGQPVQVDVPIAVPGATWFAPRTVASLRPGTQVMVFARMAEPGHAITATIGGSERRVELLPATPALLERAAARVEIDELEARLALTTAAAPKAALAHQIEQRSIATRVISSQTSMLVLDRDEDYARYGIDRTALADILVVGPQGLEQQHRTFVASKPHPRGPGTPSREQMLAGLTGHGSGTGTGWGEGHAYGRLSGRMASVPTVRIGQPMAMGSLDKSMIRRYIHRHTARITYCYEHELPTHPHLHGTVLTQFQIDPQGHVVAATASGMDETVAQCVAGVLSTIEFPSGNDGNIVVSYPFTFRRADGDPEADAEDAATALPATVDELLGQAAAPPDPAAPPPPAPVVAAPPPPPAPEPQAQPEPSPEPQPQPQPEPPPIAVTPRLAVAPPRTDDTEPFGPPASALTGKLATILRAVRSDPTAALPLALAWRDAAPTDILALVGLGEAYEARGDRAAAARAYGSIIDLYPTRADYRRFAGERLERLGAAGRALAIDTYRRAVLDRPDQITGHRLLAYALLRSGDLAGAFAAILAGVDQPARSDSYAGAARVFARDAGMIGAVYAAHGGNRDRIVAALAKRHLELVTEASTRFLLYWETDANDVDLHVRDRFGNHAYFAHKDLESGGALYADITTGYGPECFEIIGAPTAGPYELGVHYYAQGPMGYGMGLLQVARFDGASFTFEDRPYVIMRDRAHVALGSTR